MHLMQPSGDEMVSGQMRREASQQCIGRLLFNRFQGFMICAMEAPLPCTFPCSIHFIICRNRSAHCHTFLCNPFRSNGKIRTIYVSSNKNFLSGYQIMQKFRNLFQSLSSKFDNFVVTVLTSFTRLR